MIRTILLFALDLLSIAQILPSKGVLKHSSNFVYLDVDDAYIHQLIPFIQKDGFEEPPYFGESLVGAHITVIYPDEIEKFGITNVPDCGESIPFTLKDSQIFNPPNWKEVDQVFCLLVEAPKLDQIRAKYGLPKRKYDFHITVGVKRASVDLKEINVE